MAAKATDRATDRDRASRPKPPTGPLVPCKACGGLIHPRLKTCRFCGADRRATATPHARRAAPLPTIAPPAEAVPAESAEAALPALTLSLSAPTATTAELSAAAELIAAAGGLQRARDILATARLCIAAPLAAAPPRSSAVE